MRCFALVALCIAVVAGAPSSPERISGGTVTTINQYPAVASVEYSRNLQTFQQTCAGSIVNTRTILSVAHCIHGSSSINWRIRVGSAFAGSGGTIYNIMSVIIHQNYNPYNHDNDIAILRTTSVITYINNAVQAGLLAGPNYNVADNQVLWAVGWGSTYFNSQPSEQLRHVQMWAVNQNTCRTNWATRNRTITDNMMCAGNPTGGGRDQCLGDAGGPLYHNGVIVGVSSWNIECSGIAQFPSINTRVSRFAAWISSNA